jgi:signal transduction histidine kinase
VAESLETHLFRITQEALTNIARHSGATEAWVSLMLEGERLVLTITDNGQGLTAVAGHPGPSLGMVGMRARARQVNGELLVENRQEGGLRIRVDAPLQKAGLNVEQEDSSFVG